MAGSESASGAGSDGGTVWGVLWDSLSSPSLPSPLSPYPIGYRVSFDFA